MRKIIIITGGILLFSTLQGLAQMKPAVTLSKATIKGLNDKKVWLINPQSLPVKNAGKSTAKTTSPLRLYAIAGYDLTRDTLQIIDSTHFSYSGARGWGTDDPVAFDETFSFADDGSGLSQYATTTQTFDSHDNILTHTSLFFKGTAYDKQKTTYTYDTYDNIEVQTEYTMDGGGPWIKNRETHYYYSGAGGPDSMIGQRYAEDGTATDRDKEIYTYNAKGNKVDILTQYQESGGDLVNVGHTTRTYDAGGMQLLKEVYATYQYTTDTWNEFLKYTYTYDASGNRLTEQMQIWDDDKAIWSDFFSVVNTYTSGLLNTATMIDYGKSDTTRLSFSYNGDNLVSLILKEHADAGTFNRITQTAYYYDDKATSIATVNRGGSLSLYPVPANNELSLDLQWDKVQKATVSITDLQGRVWQQWTLPAVQQYKEKVALNSLPSGNYVLRISGSENARVTQPFTVLR